ncbi:MAG: CDP-alcohol phosphatidyltransferase family protein [Bacteroidetes bacterium]|nr:CDP-alcohol phosphatidyltransferase family protein [Bacteroidota bacterium]
MEFFKQLKRVLNWIPNMLTLANASLGALAISNLNTWNGKWVMLALAACLLLDLFDGALARMLKVSGPLGKQLDSLADVISFGFLPAAMAVQILESSTNPSMQALSVLGWLILPASALRLGRFNLDDGQSTHFKGLPTPANALFWAGIWWTLNVESGIKFQEFPVWAMGISLALSVYLLNAPIWLFSLKSLRFSFFELRYRILFISFALVLFLCTSVVWFWLILPAYAACSFLYFRSVKPA